MVREIDNEFVVQKPVTDSIPQPNQAEYVESVDTTGATEYTGGVEGAIDRLTYEIAGSLRERKTLVVWLFDASLSLKERREAIANRFENVYAQLGQLEVNTDRALKTAVASYGSTTHLITQDPVDDVKDVIQAVRSVKPDETGKENVFSAVQMVTTKWKSYRTAMHRNVMIVIVTDERGDDFAMMEDVIRDVRRLGIRVYCVGNAAPFGREKGYVTWRYEDGSSEELPVDSGPETIAAERLRLGFWGTSGRDLERMSAGFGPWAMTRLCAETGGLYLVSEESVKGPRFNPAVMRVYAPDYRPVRVYEEELRTNMAKRMLVETAADDACHQVPSPQLAFKADNDNVLRKEITEAQKPQPFTTTNCSRCSPCWSRAKRTATNSPRRAGGRVSIWQWAGCWPCGAGFRLQHRARGNEVHPQDLREKRQQPLAVGALEGNRRRSHDPQNRQAG